IAGAAARVEDPPAVKPDLPQAAPVKLLAALGLVSHPVIQVREVDRLDVVEPVSVGKLTLLKHAAPPRQRSSSAAVAIATRHRSAPQPSTALPAGADRQGAAKRCRMRRPAPRNP